MHKNSNHRACFLLDRHRHHHAPRTPPPPHPTHTAAAAATNSAHAISTATAQQGGSCAGFPIDTDHIRHGAGRPAWARYSFYDVKELLSLCTKLDKRLADVSPAAQRLRASALRSPPFHPRVRALSNASNDLARQSRKDASLETRRTPVRTDVAGRLQEPLADGFSVAGACIDFAALRQPT